MRSKTWPRWFFGGLGLLLVGILIGITISQAAAPPSTRTPLPSKAARFETLPPGSPLPDGEECAQRVRRSGWEPRPENTEANHTTPEEVSLPDWEGYDPRANDQLLPRIDGNFTGTTDEIIQWGACKWGFDEDIVRAMAVRESNWTQDEVGDYENDEDDCVPGDSPPCPTSFGLLQIKHYYFPGTFPDSIRSTAFNVDYVLAKLRACYEGWIPFLNRNGGYRAGDLWGCVGYHWSGGWKERGGERYVENVQRALAEKPWTQWDG